ncbi:RDD family protein [Streptomyces nodosus]|uniref:Membrane protein n=1 Tax=Streptomyces nodosus TaxID=40318 RepID=A0A0B5DBH3_9ACTN|nr:RDD family protein [Streptomyces nodosus]AJE40978.1 membrane protein [Streptomyces nodosus]MBB4792085.1 putative RDD family membrane protein YckC [Streptomyces nodosus]QEV39520.1 RDD family protein [Streptomyces nodosus]
MSDLVTGEAVALELRPAKLPSRALAVVLDLVVALVAYILVTVALVASTSGLDSAARTALSIATFVLVLVGGPIAVETLSHGRSLGKLACGLRVVRDDGGPIRFRHALVRGAVGVIEILGTFGCVACIASLVSERGRRLGDVFAGTLVVRERVPTVSAASVPPPPPWLVGRFSELDLSTVPDGLWLAIRQYLTRMHQLDPQVGWAMSARLASDLAACTGTPAPHGIPPAAYLSAVVQERQEREKRRMYTGPGGAGAAEVPPEELSVPGGPVPSHTRSQSQPQAQAPRVPEEQERPTSYDDPSDETSDGTATGFAPPA